MGVKLPKRCLTFRTLPYITRVNIILPRGSWEKFIHILTSPNNLLYGGEGVQINIYVQFSYPCYINSIFKSNIRLSP